MIRTDDYSLINRIINNNKIYPYIVDDGSPEYYETNESDDIYYLIDREGLAIYSPLNFITYETHWCILSKYRGKAVSFVKDTIRWMFRNTNCMKVEVRIPEINIRSYKFAKKLGFNDEGVSKKSFMINGDIYNMNILGVEKCRGQ